MKITTIWRHFALLVAVGLCATSVAMAEVKLPHVFGSNMVLQREQRDPVWGTATAGEKVTVTINEQTKEATADANGNWTLKLDPMKAGGPYVMEVKGQSNTVKFENVMVGEVWVCSGQSNMKMEMEYLSLTDRVEEPKKAVYPNIRFFKIEENSVDKPQDDVDARWAPCGPGSAKYFSAAAYYFGRKLHQELKVPVGLIAPSFGGSVVQAWTSREAMEGIPAFEPLIASVAKDHPSAKVGHLYNAMVHPIIPFGIRGVIWYQGENNGGYNGGDAPDAGCHGYQYRFLIPVMVQDWRERWDQGDFPFYYVQLPGCFRMDFKEIPPKAAAWSELRESQAAVLTMPNTGEVVTIDIGDSDLHPLKKLEVGLRLANLALVKDYGMKDLVISGPRLASTKIDGNQVTLTFTDIAGGLVTKATKNVPDTSVLKGFTIAGKDRVFHWADAKLFGDKVVLSSPKVAQPVAVRYAWQNDPECNLFNKAGLPAGPFRTDKWPLATINNYKW
ncbi:MAG: sialate O-acetylesterase [Planctomycetota bacterium]|nr:sialate O-acetylesterase [Planctomycetota bacterium]